MVRERTSTLTYFHCSGTTARLAPIIPVSAQLRFNIDAVVEALCNVAPPNYDFTADPRMVVIRSFDVNKPGAEVKDLKGGVAGGSILQGVFKVGQEVEIRPGLITRDANGHNTCRPLRSRIISLHAEQNHLQFAVPGGLIGVGTLVDPALCRADRLLGMVMSSVGKGPSVYVEIKAEGKCLVTSFCPCADDPRLQCSCCEDCWVSRRTIAKRQRSRNSPSGRHCLSTLVLRRQEERSWPSRAATSR